MKAATTLSLGDKTATQLTELANQLSVPRSSLADLLLRYGLARATPEKLASWAQGEQRRSIPGAVHVRGSEAIALRALTAEWQTFEQLRIGARLGVGVLNRALHGLQTSGRAELDTVIGARDAKGRAINSRWRLPGAPA